MTHYIKSFIAATMDEGKKWMIISGGGGKAGGLKVDTNTKSNPFAGLQFARLYFDGFSSIEMDKKTYRVQITGVGADGSITLGKLGYYEIGFIRRSEIYGTQTSRKIQQAVNDILHSNDWQKEI